MTLPTYVVPVAIGAAGVALGILGYLFVFRGRKLPAGGAISAAVPKKIPTKKVGGGGYAGGGGSAAKTDWKLTGYRAGLAQGKADKKAKRPFGTSFAKSDKPPASVPAGTDPTTKLPLKQIWTLGWIEGYPVGYGSDASGAVAKAPKYALDAFSVEEWDAVEPEESETGGAGAAVEEVEGAVDEAGGAVEEKLDDWFGGGESEVDTSGVAVAVGRACDTCGIARVGKWGPRTGAMLAACRTAAPVRR